MIINKLEQEAKDEHDHKMNRIKAKVLVMARMRVLHQTSKEKAFIQLSMAKNKSNDGMIAPETFDKIQDINSHVVKFGELKKRDSENEKFPIKAFNKIS